MAAAGNLTKAIRAVLERETAINLHQYPIRIEVDEGVAVLEGEVENIIVKRLAPRLVAGVGGVKGVLDRLRVVPGERRGDGAIRDAVYRALAEELLFNGYTIRPGEGQPAFDKGPGDTEKNTIEIRVTDGVVTLTGSVGSLSHKRWTDVLAWWVRGTVDVNNRLHIVPPQEDSDYEITDSLRMVLEKDPALDAIQILASTQDHVITLKGLVRSREQKRLAEFDAWYILGVHHVNNELEVHSY
jgi:osmotically-inducible protein OsmY